MELSERCIQSLEKEGFTDVYEWQDKSGTVYSEHAHQDKVTIFITEGSLTLSLCGETHELKAGDRFGIPPGVNHSAVVGQRGCQYVVGEMLREDS